MAMTIEIRETFADATAAAEFLHAIGLALKAIRDKGAALISPVSAPTVSVAPISTPADNPPADVPAGLAPPVAPVDIQPRPRRGRPRVKDAATPAPATTVAASSSVTVVAPPAGDIGFDALVDAAVAFAERSANGDERLRTWLASKGIAKLRDLPPADWAAAVAYFKAGA